MVKGVCLAGALALAGCAGRGPSAPEASLVEAVGPVGPRGLYAPAPLVREGIRHREGRPDAAPEAVRLIRTATDAGFEDLLEVGPPGSLRPSRTNAFVVGPDGSVSLASTTNHERDTTVRYEPPLAVAPAEGFAPGEALRAEATARSTGVGGTGTARLETVYVGDETIDLEGSETRARRIESDYDLTLGMGVRVRRVQVRWLVDGRVVRERAHEIVMAGPIVVSETRVVEDWSR